MADWYRYSIEQLQKKFETDPVSGLSASVYENKDIRQDVNFSRKEKATGSRYIGSFSVLLCIFASVCLLFTGELSFIPIILISASSFFIFSLLNSRAQAAFENNTSSAAPKITVKRSGKLFTVTHDKLFPGDLVLLQPGDVAFFDARLTYTKDLHVLEKHICDGDGVKDEYFEAYVPGLEPKEQKNMIFAGSIISKGYAYAIVCSVSRELGQPTHLGKNKLLKKTKQISESLSIFFLISILLYTILCIIFSDTPGVLNAFTVSLCAAACSMCEFYPAVIDIAISKAIKIPCGTSNNKFVSVPELSSLSRIKNISVLAFDRSSSLCPSTPYIAKILAYGKEFDADNIEHLKRCRDVLYTAVLAGGTDDVTSSSDRSVEYILNRIHLTSSVIYELYPIVKHKSAKGLSLFDCSVVNYKGKHKLCCRGSAHHILHRCSSMLTESGIIQLKKEELDHFISIASEYEKKGSQLIVCASKYGTSFEDIRSELCLEAIFVLPIEPTQQAVSAIADLQAAGIRPILFCDDITDSNYELARSLNIVTDENQVLTAYELNANNLNILKLQMHNYRLFQGFSSKEKKYVLDQLKKKSRKQIGILSTKFSDAAYSDDKGYTLFCVDPGSSEHHGAQALRYLSDASLPNVIDGGGVIAAATLINNIRSLFPRCSHMLRYLLFNASSAMIMLIFSIFFDVFSLSLSELLLCTCLMSTVGSLSLIFGKCEKNIDHIPENSYISARDCIGIFLSSLICCATCGIAAALSFLSVNGLELSSFVLFTSLLLSSLTAYCHIIRSDSSVTSKKEWRLTIPSVCTVVILALLSAVFPQIFSVVGISKISVWSVIYSLIPCLMLTALDLLYRIKTKKF